MQTWPGLEAGLSGEPSRGERPPIGAEQILWNGDLPGWTNYAGGAIRHRTLPPSAISTSRETLSLEGTIGTNSVPSSRGPAVHSPKPDGAPHRTLPTQKDQEDACPPTMDRPADAPHPIRVSDEPARRSTAEETVAFAAHGATSPCRPCAHPPLVRRMEGRPAIPSTLTPPPNHAFEGRERCVTRGGRQAVLLQGKRLPVASALPRAPRERRRGRDRK